MAGYKHPCRYCGKFIPPDSEVCPICGKISPLSIRCPKCRSPIEKGWKRCSQCGQVLETKCPYCGKITFLDAHCEHCGSSLMVVCPNKKCGAEQIPIGGKCIKCGKPL